MATTYTDNFSFPLLGSGSADWDAVINGMMEKLDKLLAEARNPLIWDTNTAGRIDSDTEILTFDGEVMLWAD